MIKRKISHCLNGIIFFIIILLIARTYNVFANNSLYQVENLIELTEEERNFINENPVIKAVSLDGAAPIQFKNENNEIQGISIQVLKTISNITGLKFEYDLYNSFEEIKIDDYDIFFGIPKNYADFQYNGMILSKPYLKTETVLFFNSSINSGNLGNKIYAAVKGSPLPEGVDEEYAIYFDTREESLNAVEKGIADYGYGNPYSIAYYTIKNNYKDIVTVPIGKEGREYCIGFFKKNALLISIINKAIDSIDDLQMNSIILDVTSHIERKISPTMIVDEYGVIIFTVLFAFITILLISIVVNIRTNRKLRIQNRRYETLAEMANEYLFEYFVKKNELILSEKIIHLFKVNEDLNTLKEKLKNILKGEDGEQLSEIKIQLTGGGYKVFKAVVSYVFDDKEVNSIMGKLIDISEEFTEKEELISMSKTDGLTGLYNPIATKEMIEEKLRNKDENRLDAFLLIDLDYFKEINDTMGHLTGDYVLKSIGESLKNTFRKTDIMGRVGGDEFCAYLIDVPSAEFVYNKCCDLMKQVNSINIDLSVSMTIGVTIIKDKCTYDDLFNRADEAMYEGKHQGKGKIVFCDYCKGNYEYEESK